MSGSGVRNVRAVSGLVSEVSDQGSGVSPMLRRGAGRTWEPDATAGRGPVFGNLVWYGAPIFGNYGMVWYITDAVRRGAVCVWEPDAAAGRSVCVGAPRPAVAP